MWLGCTAGEQLVEAEAAKCRRVLTTQICWGWAKLKETAMLVTVYVLTLRLTLNLIISPISNFIHYFRHLKKQTRCFSEQRCCFLLHALLVEYIFRWKAINHVSGFHSEHAMQSVSHSTPNQSGTSSAAGPASSCSKPIRDHQRFMNEDKRWG